MKGRAAAEGPRSMVVAGVMSGTSADGLDVALVRIEHTAAAPKIKLLGHRSFPYSPTLRKHVLAAMDASAISVAELARLNWRLGEVYADCIARTCTDLNVSTGAQRSPLALIGMHGQTLYHQSISSRYAGALVRSTWQTGEPAVVRERLGVPVISDFRPADLAAGGQGAPLVPMLDFCLFRSPERNRILLNLGGIANVTIVPAGADIEQVIAFDTGPANMVVDALMSHLYNRAYDPDGKIASSGQIIGPLLRRLLAEPYFSAPPPKSCGREQFGRTFADHFYKAAQAVKASHTDIIRTATELTIQSIVGAIDQFCVPTFKSASEPSELIVAGGGARNAFLIARLTEDLKLRKISLRLADDLGMPAEAKEAVAFALLAWLSWQGLPGNVPSATGASHPVVLGKVTC